MKGIVGYKKAHIVLKNNPRRDNPIIINPRFDSFGSIKIKSVEIDPNRVVRQRKNDLLPYLSARNPKRGLEKATQKGIDANYPARVLSILNFVVKIF